MNVLIKRVFFFAATLLISVFLLYHPSFAGTASSGQLSEPQVYLSVFDVEATPPVGCRLTIQEMKFSWDLGLRAKCLVIRGAG